MIVGALLDMGADTTKVVKAMESVKDFIENCENIEVVVRDVSRKGFHAKKVDVRTKEVEEMSGLGLIKATSRCLEYLELSKKAKQFALNSIKTLVEAEAKIHDEPIEKVHLHEAGSVDTPADIIGTAVAADDLGIFNMRVYSTPVAVGGGLFRFSHGTVSSPAPASLEMLRSRNFPFKGGPIEYELATPTGVSMLVNLANEIVHLYPSMKAIKVGYGAGMRDFEEIPNVLRVVLGEPINYNLIRDEIMVVETNLDDVTGEVIGYTINRLLLEGAKDVSVIPIFTKKNRPGQILKVITDRQNFERLSRILMEETGSLGVRIYPCERRTLTREMVPVEIEIDGSKEQVSVKVAKDRKGEIVQVKPEYEDVRRIAEKTHKPLRKIMKVIEGKVQKFFEVNP